MFEEENALPGSKLHFSVGNGHGLAGAGQDHADVRWHVIAAFGAVREIIGVLGHESIEEFFQVASRGWICILHQDNAATGVLNKGRHGPASDAAPVDRRLQFVRNFVQAFADGANFELVVMDMHREAS